MTDHEIVLAIQQMLDGIEWDADILPAIADLLTRNGYAISEFEEDET